MAKVDKGLGEDRRVLYTRGLQGLGLADFLRPMTPSSSLPYQALTQTLALWLVAGLESLGSVNGKAWVRAGVGMG